jgi:pimeloyl-[acyl-carrier protein] methyl ester esterase
MEHITALVLPGLDGSGVLLREFVDAAPVGFTARALSLPDSCVANYFELADRVGSELNGVSECVLIGESFSGPLAVILAEKYPTIVRHLVLVATFVTPPISKVLGIFPWTLIFRCPMPRFASRLLIGKDSHLLSPLRTAARTQSAKTKANRIKLLSEVNVTPQLAKLTCPITYLQPDFDRLVSEQHCRQVAEANLHVQVRQIQGPHLILQSRPIQCWAQIESAVNAGSSR